MVKLPQQIINQKEELEFLLKNNIDSMIRNVKNYDKDEILIGLGNLRNIIEKLISVER